MKQTLLHLFLLAAASMALPGGGWAADRAHVSFNNDVLPVLTKAGCNSGACHANTNGKGGLKLSLWSEDAAFDYAALVRQHESRRVDLLDPDASLILLKPSGRLAHQGGVRFNKDSLEYRIFRDWIAAGAPGPDSNDPSPVSLEVLPERAVLVDPLDQVSLRVTAKFSDGSSRDVTELAVFEPSNNAVSVSGSTIQREILGETTVLVRFLNQQRAVRLAFIPARPQLVGEMPASDNLVDQHVFAKLRELNVVPSAVCDDATFVRRAFVDCLGILPTTDESRQFVADAAPDKRARLIDDLLQRPEFADHFALKWSDLLRNEEKVLDSKGVDAFYFWIRDWIAEGRPLDEFTRRILTARGSTYDNPPANFYRAVRDPHARGETVARLFLGVRLQCARCHNHPFDRWTQDDYYSWSALFARIDYKILENNRQDKLDKNAFNDEQIVLMTTDGEVKNARTGKNARPRLLSDAPPLDVSADRLTALADWVGSAENELFVHSQVNFVWYHLMGKGLVEPLDDFRATNPPSNPALLEALGRDFAAHDFDLRHLVRTIMNSRSYQASAEPNETNRDDENFSRAVVRRLPAEVVLDAQCQVMGVPAKFNGYELGTRAGQVRGVERVRARDKRPTAAERFLKTFGKPERQLACECERSNETTLKQALVLIGDDGLNQRLTQAGNRLDRWAKSDRSDAAIIEELFWTALSRPPTSEELQASEVALRKSADRFATLQDLAWALMNSKEFLFRK